MTGLTLRGNRTVRRGTASLAAVGVVFALAACSTSVASTEDVAPSPTVTKKKVVATPTPSQSSARPTYSRKPSPTPSPTKAEPIFVASLPDSVSAVVGQRIVVQLPTEQNERWSASASGGASVGGTSFVAPPEEQPDAPGTSITNITVTKAGSAKVTFTLKSTNGRPSSTQTLTIKTK